MKYLIVKIIKKGISTLESFTKKTIIIAKQKKYDTAVMSKMGFWYTGNVFDTSDIAYGISQNGTVEEEETNLVLRTLNDILKKQESLVFFDIGANTGYYGILAGSLDRKKIKVHSFEPVREHLDCLKKTVYLNRLEETVTVHEGALGDEDTEKTLYIAGSGTTLTKEFNDNKFSSTVTIKVAKLDSLIAANTIPYPDFVKIDVEGYEYKVLCGAKNTLMKNLPPLFIEIAYTLKSIGRPSFVNEDYQKTFDFLADLGYSPYTLSGNTLKPFDPTSKPDGVQMYLFNTDKKVS